MKKEKVLGLDWNIFFTGMTSFLTDTSVKMLYPILPIFLKTVLGASVTSVSLIEGIAESTASVLKALSGWWSDKIGKNKPFMIIGYAATAIVTPFFGFVTSWYQVLVMRFLERVGKGIRTAPRDSLIAASGNKSAGKNFGFHKMMDNSGAILGPLLAFLILKYSSNNYKLLFFLATIPAILGVMSIVFFVREAKKEESGLPAKIHFSDFPKGYYVFLVIAFIFALGNSTDALLILRAQDLGTPSSYTPMLYMLFSAASVFFAVPFGKLSDKIGREKIIIVGFLVYSFVYFGFACSSTIIEVGLLFLIYGVYSALTDGVQKALVSDLVKKEFKGTGLGLYNALIGITLLPASLIGGFLWDNVNHSAPFLFGSILSLFASILLFGFYIHGKRD